MLGNLIDWDESLSITKTSNSGSSYYFTSSSAIIESGSIVGMPTRDCVIHITNNRCRKSYTYTSSTLTNETGYTPYIDIEAGYISKLDTGGVTEASGNIKLDIAGKEFVGKGLVESGYYDIYTSTSDYSRYRFKYFGYNLTTPLDLYIKWNSSSTFNYEASGAFKYNSSLKSALKFDLNVDVKYI